jgi:hypothetical protein
MEFAPHALFPFSILGDTGRVVYAVIFKLRKGKTFLWQVRFLVSVLGHCVCVFETRSRGYPST